MTTTQTIDMAGMNNEHVIDTSNEPLTVARLRDILAALPGDFQITIDDPANSWWNNVSGVGIPDPTGDSPFTTVTLIAGDAFDTRQI